ncbi:hypothetical protein EV421DRAFT_1739436 [Armillaria borealis]|uniref:Uncharacterized protein n=1 Tax=Armillaria borealis TaxID=47425 RepID=A0AA39J5X6_9AGAR|nr:hypothetical protein EV421DRAFT_1739436 [Armillaria borealis]
MAWSMDLVFKRFYGCLPSQDRNQGRKEATVGLPPSKYQDRNVPSPSPQVDFMSSSPIRGPSTQAGPLSSDESVELELLQERVGELFETIDSLEDALLDQRRQMKMAKDHARTERQRAEQATECAENAHNNEAWWRVVYYQENYKLRAQVVNLEEEKANLKGALSNPMSLQAAALHDDYGPHEGTAPFQCPVCNELIKHRPICNLLVEHSVVYLPDENTGKTANLGPKVKGAWAQLFPNCQGGHPGSLT